MRSAPTLLFVDQDPQALTPLLMEIEPIYPTFSLRAVGELEAYTVGLRPGVVLLSDRLSWRRKNTVGLLAQLRTYYKGPIFVMVDDATDAVRAHWREAGANDAVAHPGRVRDRMRLMEKEILAVAAPSYATEA